MEIKKYATIIDRGKYICKIDRKMLSDFFWNYDDIEIFSNDRIKAIRKNTYFGNETFIFNEKGEEIIKIEYDVIELNGKYFFEYEGKNACRIYDYNGKRLFYISIALSNQVYLVRNAEGNIGVIKFNDYWSKYDVVLPFSFDVERKYLQDKYGNYNYDECIFYLKNDIGKYGGINENGGITIPFEFDKIICIVNNRDMCFSDKYEKYSSIITFESNLYLVLKNEKRGLYQGNGKVIFEPKYDRILKTFNYSRDIEKCVFVVIFNGKYGLFNGLGNELLPPSMDKISKYKNFEHIRVEKNEQIGICNSKGQLIVPIKFSDIKPFNSGHFLVEDNCNKWGVYEKEQEILPCEFDKILPTKKDYADTICVYKGDKCGLYSKDGTEIIPIEYEQISDWSDGDLYMVKNNGLWGFIDKNNKNIIADFKYDRVTVYVNECYLVKKDEIWILVDNEGNEVEKDVKSIKVEDGYEITWYKVTNKGKLVKEQSYYENDDYTNDELDSMYWDAFDNDRSAYWNID